MHVDLTVTAAIPACISDPETVAQMRRAAGEALSDRCSLGQGYATRAGEDMAEFFNRVPGCFFLVGCGNRELGIDAPHHTPEFDLDENALAIGASVVAATVLNAMAAETAR